MTKQVAFKMKLKPGFKVEYQKRHDEIWPELEDLLKQAGIFNYSIFLDEETDTLFAVQHLNGEIPDLTQEAIMKKWWAFMGDIMETNADQSPIAIALPRVFHLE
ncbi:L-rhamnose mutarotase [Pedobacter changchengzhani]|uniref:L-rhamnose mutarotase n=1 Tax=Pedobacter changchengzhani TaxID=2529274 RepID=A0A4R5MLP4_9SPHI|nr:L-rhamnose mutarotase [Pedobacter changchengzhani]TDG36165.1 L-rhamnose mutarotase [Pedobacter changchengzhani]